VAFSCKQVPEPSQIPAKSFVDRVLCTTVGEITHPEKDVLQPANIGAFTKLPTPSLKKRSKKPLRVPDLALAILVIRKIQ